MCRDAEGMPAAFHFLKRVKTRSEEECWLWEGVVTAEGYGRFSYQIKGQKDRKTVGAHRYGYELFTRRIIPRGYHLDHLCRVTACVNPSHLEVVTPKVNILRGNCPAAINARKTHCNSGHPLSGPGADVHLRPARGKRRAARICRVCIREYWRAKRAKRTA
jgi:hypothetical protein